jgi:outer membrane protein TolC
VLVSVVFLVSALCAYAEPVNLTLEQAVELAVANSPVLQDQGEVVSAAARNKEHAWNLFLPGITADLTGNFFNDLLYPPASNRAAPPLSSSLKMDVRLSLDTRTLYELGKRRDDHVTALMAEQEARRKFVAGVEKDYFSLVASSLDIENSLRTLALDEESYKQAKVKFERGLESELTVLNAELKLQVSRTAVVSARAGYEKKATAFKRLLGVEPQAVLALDTPLLVAEFDNSSLDVLMAGMDKRLDLEMKRRAIQAAEVAAARYHATTRLPLVNLGSSISFSMSDFSVTPGWSVH